MRTVDQHAARHRVRHREKRLSMCRVFEPFEVRVVDQCTYWAAAGPGTVRRSAAGRLRAKTAAGAGRSLRRLTYKGYGKFDTGYRRRETRKGCDGMFIPTVHPKRSCEKFGIARNPFRRNSVGLWRRTDTEQISEKLGQIICCDSLRCCLA